MKINKQMIGVVILLVFVILLIAFIEKESSQQDSGLFEERFDFDKEDNDTNNVSNDTQKTEDCLNGDCYDINETPGSGGGGSSEESPENGASVPEDADKVECGLYSEEYGVCSGTCPEGECVPGGSRNESCYCQ